MTPDNHLGEIFLQSASEVLETMCFVGVLGASSNAAETSLIGAELAFHGAPSGHFSVQVPPQTGKLLASNFLGKEAEELTEADIEQVVGELSNMICGSVLSRLESGARFELSHPSIVPAGAAKPHGNAVPYSFDLEEGSIILSMALREALPASSAA